MHHSLDQDLSHAISNRSFLFPFSSWVPCKFLELSPIVKQLPLYHCTSSISHLSQMLIIKGELSELPKQHIRVRSDFYVFYPLWKCICDCVQLKYVWPDDDDADDAVGCCVTRLQCVNVCPNFFLISYNLLFLFPFSRFFFIIVSGVFFFLHFSLFLFNFFSNYIHRTLHDLRRRLQIVCIPNFALSQ